MSAVLAGALLLASALESRGQTFHTNAVFNVTFSLPGVQQNVLVLGTNRFIFTAIPAKIANAQIIQALAPNFPSTDLSKAILMFKTADVGTSEVRSFFILRAGTNEVDLSPFFSFALPSAYATISAQTLGSIASTTNQTDYTAMQIGLQSSALSFDLQGFSNFKMSSTVDHGKVIQTQPFPTTMTVTVDGPGSAQGFPISFHGSVAFTGRKLEVVQDSDP